MLLFESLDEDKEDRTFSPIVYTSPDLPTYSNVLNSFMDHTWDGFYTGQKRLDRFPGLVIAGNKYVVGYQGTQPGNQRFKLVSESKGVTV
jgi:hypothetical protein